eukprot:SAG11_NODE_14158_length_623_cov_0.603053_1_plen_132_part_10
MWSARPLCLCVADSVYWYPQDETTTYKLPPPPSPAPPAPAPAQSAVATTPAAPVPAAPATPASAPIANGSAATSVATTSTSGLHPATVQHPEVEALRRELLKVKQENESLKAALGASSGSGAGGGPEEAAPP